MKHPPYHLRFNKSVDRLLLIETMVEMNLNSDDSCYYSLAGPFLEDMRVVDHFLPKMRLMSFERDEQTYVRQQFHSFNSRLELKNKTMTEYLALEYSPVCADAFWLDYTGFEYSLLEEFQVVLRKALPGSVVRITLRAEPELMPSKLEQLGVSPEEISKFRNKLQAEFEEKFSEVIIHPAPAVFATRTAYVSAVQNAVRLSASAALDIPGSTTDFLHVHSILYNDSTFMLSVTGVICYRAEMEKMKKKLSNIRHANFEWGKPTVLNVPPLSMKERFLLEEFLPVKGPLRAGDVLYSALNYSIDQSVRDTKQQLSAYAEYCREFPNFARLLI